MNESVSLATAVIDQERAERFENLAERMVEVMPVLDQFDFTNRCSRSNGSSWRHPVSEELKDIITLVRTAIDSDRHVSWESLSLHDRDFPTIEVLQHAKIRFVDIMSRSSEDATLVEQVSDAYLALDEILEAYQNEYYFCGEYGVGGSSDNEVSFLGQLIFDSKQIMEERARVAREKSDLFLRSSRGLTFERNLAAAKARKEQKGQGEG